MTETNLIVKEKVVKLMNSKSRYLKIPDNQFNEITHGDIAEVKKKENEDGVSLYITYKFNKNELKKGN